MLLRFLWLFCACICTNFQEILLRRNYDIRGVEGCGKNDLLRGFCLHIHTYLLVNQQVLLTLPFLCFLNACQVSSLLLPLEDISFLSLTAGTETVPEREGKEGRPSYIPSGLRAFPRYLRSVFRVEKKEKRGGEPRAKTTTTPRKRDGEATRATTD